MFPFSGNRRRDFDDTARRGGGKQPARTHGVYKAGREKMATTVISRFPPAVRRWRPLDIFSTVGRRRLIVGSAGHVGRDAWPRGTMGRTINERAAAAAAVVNGLSRVIGDVAVGKGGTTTTTKSPQLCGHGREKRPNRPRYVSWMRETPPGHTYRRRAPPRGRKPGDFDDPARTRRR